MILAPPHRGVRVSLFPCLLGIGVVLGASVAEASVIQLFDGPFGGSIGYSASGGSPGSGTGAGSGPVPVPTHGPAGGGAHTAAAGPVAPGPFFGQTPALADNGTGGFCITYFLQPAASAAAASTVTNSFNGVVANLHRQSYSNCQQGSQTGRGPGGAAPPPPPPPSAVAASYWSAHGQELLAVPKPYIAPGYALTGLPGYLETGVPVAQQFSGSTPLGSLSIAAHGTFVVDWGDGQTATFTTPGGPWPTGTVTHTWDNVGSYHVSVTEDWTATWSLGGQQGTLAALHTRGAIPAFQARQLESIRNR